MYTMIRKVVFYSGRVQGVGFRYTTANLAKQFTVAGYVQNLDDGRVRLEVQGDQGQVDGLLAAVDEAMAGKIQGRDAAELPADPALCEPKAIHSFGIRR